MTAQETQSRFDPLAALAALQRAKVSFVVIGGIARVLRGTGEVTWGLDICPSPATANLGRTLAALTELQADPVSAKQTRATGKSSQQQTIVDYTTIAGPLKLVRAPAGVPRGYQALRSGATIEHLGHGLRPAVASTADLITMAAARGLPKDRAVLPELRQILQLEASTDQLVATPSPTHEMPGPDRDRELGF